MAKLSFSEAATPARKTVASMSAEVETPAVVEPAVTAKPKAPKATKELTVVPVEAPKTQLALPTEYFEDEDASGEIMDSKYASYPSLKIVSKTSDLAETVGVGKWILGSKTQEPVVIGELSSSIPMVCMKFSMAWQEQLTYGDPNLPKMFASLKDAIDEGYTNQWNTPIPRVAEVVKALFYIPQPDGVDEPHVFNIDGPTGPAALAWFFAARTAFGTVGKSLIQAKRSFLSPEKGGMKTGLWHMSATKATSKGNTWLLAKITPKGKVTPEVSEFLRTLS